MLLKMTLPVSGEPFAPAGIGFIGSGPSAGFVLGVEPLASAIVVSAAAWGYLFAVRTRYSVIDLASWRVRRSSSSLELFSSMKKWGIFVLGRNDFGAQIHVLMNAGESFAVMLRRSVPTL